MTRFYATHAEKKMIPPVDCRAGDTAYCLSGRPMLGAVGRRVWRENSFTHTSARRFQSHTPLQDHDLPLLGPACAAAVQQCASSPGKILLPYTTQAFFWGDLVPSKHLPAPIAMVTQVQKKSSYESESTRSHFMQAYNILDKTSTNDSSY